MTEEVERLLKQIGTGGLQKAVDSARVIPHHNNNTEEGCIANGLARYGFLTECCYTFDEVDADHPVKLIPPKPHIWHMCQAFSQHRLCCFPKSRRMIVTWTLCALDLVTAMYTPYSHIYIISSDQTKSDSLVGRVRFLYDNLPDWLLKPTMTYFKGEKGGIRVVNFPEQHSFVAGLPSDPEKIRQEGATLLHIEEMAFWQWAAQAYRAMLPTIQGKGKMMIASSAQSNTHFGHIVFDEQGTNVPATQEFETLDQQLPGGAGREIA